MPRRSSAKLAAHQVHGACRKHPEFMIFPGADPLLERRSAGAGHRPAHPSERQVRTEVGVDVKARLLQRCRRFPTQGAEPIEPGIGEPRPEHARSLYPTEGTGAVHLQLERWLAQDGRLEGGGEPWNDRGVDAAEKVQREMDLLDGAWTKPLLEGFQPDEWVTQRLTQRVRQLDGDEQPPGSRLRFRPDCQPGP